MSEFSEVSAAVAPLVVRWQVEFGRNHLPWQQTRDPYRVWLSEIMLQQTQVATVLEYYGRFMSRFPDVASLAAASQDDVMGLWSGLGYYSRARNLHRCAQVVVEKHGGLFPSTAEELATLPGIGRSTAGAIASFCFSERVAILDANVRRVLTRLLAFDADLASAKNERLLWQHAQCLLPLNDLYDSMPRYTQGLMDLGASVCTPKAPACARCPLEEHCVAHRNGDPSRYPIKTRKVSRRSEAWYLLLMQDGRGKLWLERRPNSGIWAGLYCTPVFSDTEAMDRYVDSKGPRARESLNVLPTFLHVLTHRDLHIHPISMQCTGEIQPSAFGSWFGPEQWEELGLPAPLRKLLSSLRT